MFRSIVLICASALALAACIEGPTKIVNAPPALTVSLDPTNTGNDANQVLSLQTAVDGWNKAMQFDHFKYVASGGELEVRFVGTETTPATMSLGQSSASGSEAVVTGTQHVAYDRDLRRLKVQTYLKGSVRVNAMLYGLGLTMGLMDGLNPTSCMYPDPTATNGSPSFEDALHARKNLGLPDPGFTFVKN